jgi:hypothetical protein
MRELRPTAGGASKSGPQRFTIHVGAELGPDWRDWFDGAEIAVKPDGTASITVSVQDQAMLYGLLLRIRDLGVPLLGLTAGPDDVSPAP